MRPSADGGNQIGEQLWLPTERNLITPRSTFEVKLGQRSVSVKDILSQMNLPCQREGSLLHVPWKIENISVQINFVLHINFNKL